MADSIKLAKSINALIKTQDKFAKDSTALQTLISDGFAEIELRITKKRKEFEELEERFKHELASKKIELDQTLKAHGYDQAVRILSARDEMPVEKDVYDTLKTRVQALEVEMKQAVDDAIKREREKAKKSLVVQLNTKDLKNAADRAQAEAELKQKEKEVTVLEKQIRCLQEDLEKQRKLTEAVANAAASANRAPAMYTSSNSSGR